MTLLTNVAVGSIGRLTPLPNVQVYHWVSHAVANHTQAVDGFRGLGLEGVADSLLVASASQTTLARYDQNPGSSFKDHVMSIMSCIPCRTRLLLAEKLLHFGLY